MLPVQAGTEGVSYFLLHRKQANGGQETKYLCNVQGKIDENKEGGIMLMSGKDFFLSSLLNPFILQTVFDKQQQYNLCEERPFSEKICMN